MTLEDVIGKLELATEGSRELDAEIYWLVCPDRARTAYWNAATGLPRPIENMGGGLGRSGVEAASPRYTTSLDAALTLVPEGWTVARISQNDDKSWASELREGYLTSYDRVVFGHRNHKGPLALSLCIAALRARSAISKATGREG